MVQRNRIGKRKGGPFWSLDAPLANGVPKYLLNLAADLPGNQVPLQPWAEALLKEPMETSGNDCPASSCLPPGMPNITFRQIFTEGRALPGEAEPTWMVLCWHVGGDQLAVQTTGIQ
jgi:hypothetical protein